MTAFELEWLRGEKEQHARLLYQLKRELAEQRNRDQPLRGDRTESPYPRQRPVSGHRTSSTSAR